MAQTPYELRFNYYMAAKTQLSDQYDAKIQEIRLKRECGATITDFPSHPTNTEIFSLAEEIKAFAEKK